MLLSFFLLLASTVALKDYSMVQLTVQVPYSFALLKNDEAGGTKNERMPFFVGVC